MTATSDHDHEFSESMVADTETGERVQGTPLSGVVVPSGAGRADLAHLDSELADMVAMFADPEPTPREVMGWILKQEEMDEVDPEDAARSIVARILMADSAEDVLAVSKVTHAKDILQMPIEIHSVKWQRGGFEEGANCYAVIAATLLQDDERVTVTCGGVNVMTQLVKLGIIGAYPIHARIVQSAKPTAKGYFPLWLEPA